MTNRNVNLGGNTKMIESLVLHFRKKREDESGVGYKKKRRNKKQTTGKNNMQVNTIFLVT